MNELVVRDFFHWSWNSLNENVIRIGGEMNARKFFAELKWRHVYRVAIAYGVVAWLFIQVATQVFPFFEIPNWIVRVVVLTTVLGFPIALITAWAFEMTPEGLKRADQVKPNESIPRWSTRKFAALVMSVAILAAGVPLVHGRKQGDQGAYS